MGFGAWGLGFGGFSWRVWGLKLVALRREAQICSKERNNGEAAAALSITMPTSALHRMKSG